MVNSPLIEAAKSTALDQIKASRGKLVGQGQRRHDDQSTPVVGNPKNQWNILEGVSEVLRISG